MLRTTLALYPDSVEAVVCATICLHNFIMKREQHIAGFQQYCPPRFVDYYYDNGNIVQGSWRDKEIPGSVTRLNRVGPNCAATIAMKQQDTIAAYFTSKQGEVPWQWQIVLRGRNINVS